MEKLLVIGATGQSGKSVANQLLIITQPEKAVIPTIDSARAEYFRSIGIDIRIRDFDDLLLLQKALKGIDKVLLICGTVDAAQNAGVKQIVYTGVSIKNPDILANQFLIQSYFQTEG